MARHHPAKLITMAPEAWERIDAIAARWGTTRSGALQRLVREAPMPRPLPAPKGGPGGPDSP